MAAWTAARSARIGRSRRRGGSRPHGRLGRRLAPGMAPARQVSREQSRIRASQMAVQLHEPETQARARTRRRPRSSPGGSPSGPGGARRRAVDKAVVRVFEIGVDVPQHSAVDVPLVVGRRADVDLHHPQSGSERCSASHLASTRTSSLRGSSRLEPLLSVVVFMVTSVSVDAHPAVLRRARCGNVGETLTSRNHGRTAGSVVGRLAVTVHYIAGATVGLRPSFNWPAPTG